MPVLDVALDVRAQETVTRELLLPIAKDLLLLVREDGEDVVVRLKSHTGTVQEADTPIRRTGVQHFVFDVARGERYTLEIQGKEHDNAHGRVHVRVVAMRGAGFNRACVAPLRSFAKADVAYALGQSVTRGIAQDPRIDATRSYESSVQAYRAAADQLAANGVSPLLGEAEHSVGAAYYLGLGDWAQSATWAERAGQTHAAIGDAYGKARSEALLAAALIELPAPANNRDRNFARQLLQSAAAFHEARGEVYEQALALNNVGLAYYVDGTYDAALDWYRRALPLFEQRRELTRHVQVLSNVALVETEVGQFAEAVQHYERALSLAPRRELTVFMNILNNSALANYAYGSYDKALSQYGEALELAIGSQNSFYQGVSLHGIGIVYTMLGEQSMALQHFERALALRPRERDQRGRRATLREIGEIQRNRGQAGQALAAHEEALTMASAPDTNAAVRLLIARDLFALGRPDDALARLAPVLEAKVPGNDSSWSNALIERARYRASTGDLAAATADVDLALTGERVRETPGIEFAARLEQARIARLRGESKQAFAAIDRALVLAEELRLQSANPTLRATALQRARPAFDLKISMLAEQYAAAESGRKAGIALQALECAEQARARALEDFRRFDSGGLPAELSVRRAQLYLTLANRQTALDWAVERGEAGAKQVRYIRTEIAALRRSLDEIDARIGAASRESQPRGKRGTDISVARLPADVAILEYWLGANDAFVWELTRNRVVLRQLGPSARVTDAALAFHDALRKFATVPVAQRLARSSDLYTRVLEPVNDEVLARRTLIVIPDGALHYVPFAALRPAAARAEYMIQSHDVAMAPSLRALLAKDASPHIGPRPRRMLLVADPVFEQTDSRFQTASGRATHEGGSMLAVNRDGGRTFARLPGTAAEADLIARLMAPDDLQRLDGFSATRERFLGAGLEGYRFIHVASHAIADSQTPQASALIFSTIDRQGRTLDGRVLAADFVNVRLNADLVVLSGCDTALGREIAGEGLIGLRYVVLARGARAVVASLWPVPDASSAEIMQALYAGMLREKAEPWVALSAAMRQMLSGKYSDPGIWATYDLTLGHLAGGQPGQ